ncbi:polysaccharide biosynthesis/export family protein [uncultured Acinetobacter sp.]|uniref:polysaccharide biosynthesis/export family protein n=1 Tax=uncultured Acinetobacter sp. TaxID=165433 RepID=UPI0026181A9F|nr:polysaccharide biosynthesis/export family protein [uncultured Acinetobacter sp.]
MKHYQLFFILAISIGTVGCAVTSGLQTYDIPSEGKYTTDLGTQVNVIKITQQNLFSIQPISNDYQKTYYQLLKSPQSYYLNSGDVLSIQFWAYPELSTVSNDPKSGYRIDHNGYINLPLIGNYKSTDKTIAQINNELRKKFSSFLKNPDLIARIIAYESQPFSVQGGVKNGGQFFLTDRPTSIYTALSLAGGVSETTNNAFIQLVRDGITYDLNAIELEKIGLSLHKLLVQPNDTIYVVPRENQKIYIMGEAFRNQAITVRDQGLTLGDALGESLGLNPLSASASRVYILRTNKKEHRTELYHLNLLNFGDYSLANQFQLHSNDVIYVDATGLVRWQRIINQIVPFSNAITSFDRLGQL